jgi:thymidine kinase
MVKLIVGVMGSGKTKTLIGMVNAATEASNGSVVCIEKGNKLNYDITYKARLIDTEAYGVQDAQALYGFIAGITASNNDITDIFVDSALKICGNDLAAFRSFVTEVDKLSAKEGFQCVMTVSAKPEDCIDTLKQYM